MTRKPARGRSRRIFKRLSIPGGNDVSGTRETDERRLGSQAPPGRGQPVLLAQVTEHEQCLPPRTSGSLHCPATDHRSPCTIAIFASQFQSQSQSLPMLEGRAAGKLAVPGR